MQQAALWHSCMNAGKSDRIGPEFCGTYSQWWNLLPGVHLGAHLQEYSHCLPMRHSEGQKQSFLVFGQSCSSKGEGVLKVKESARSFLALRRPGGGRHPLPPLLRKMQRTTTPGAEWQWEVQSRVEFCHPFLNIYSRPPKNMPLRIPKRPG